MGAFGRVLGFAGMAGLVAGFIMDGSVASGVIGRVSNIDLMNFKQLLATSGGACLVAGAVLAGADEICATVKNSAKADATVRQKEP